MLKTATIVSRGHRSRTLLNLLFFRSHTFWKRSFTTPWCSSCFHFRSCLLILRYIPRQLSRNETPLLPEETTSLLNKLFLGNLRTNHEPIILPSSQSKINKKTTPFLDQSAFSNIVLYVIKWQNLGDLFWRFLSPWSANIFACLDKKKFHWKRETKRAIKRARLKFTRITLFFVKSVSHILGLQIQVSSISCTPGSSCSNAG